MSTPTARYHDAIAAARDVALRLTLTQERELLDILEEYAREIEQAVAAGLESHTAAAVLAEVSALVDAMSQDLAGSVGDGIRLTARRIAEIQASATAELISAAGSTLSVAAAFSGTGARAAQAILARPELAEAFVTIRSESAAAANRILRRGIARGAPASAIARELRQYIAMPDSLLEGDGTLLADRRRIGYQAIQDLGYEPTPENLALVRQDASRIAYRASTIARTEVMQAEAETFAQGAADSPVVAYVEVRLSYRHTEPCACEPIAQLDLYGFGPGRYDPRQVPPRPHPRCWCPRSTVLRPESEWGAERGPLPDLAVDLEQAAADAGISPSSQVAFQRAVELGRGRMIVQVAEPDTFRLELDLSGNRRRIVGGGPTLPPRPRDPRLDTALGRVERKIIKRSREEGYVLTLNGREFDHAPRPGRPSHIGTIDITDEQAQSWEHMVFTHVHPQFGASFSPDDIEFAYRWNVAEVRALDGKQREFLYTLRRPATGWPRLDVDVFERRVAEVQRKVMDDLRASGASVLTLQRETFHQVWELLKDEFSLDYTRTPWLGG